MEYEAQFGKVKTGDYVIVVTNNYMKRSTTTTVGMVQDDGYVYCGNSGISKRQIGSDGCPVCKLDAKLVPEGIAKSIKNFIISEANKQACPKRYFVVTTTRTLKLNGVVKGKEQVIDRVMKKTLPMDTPKNEVRSAVIDNVYRKHYGSLTGSWYETMNYLGRNIVSTVDINIDVKEVTYAEYANVKQREIKLL